MWLDPFVGFELIKGCRLVHEGAVFVVSPDSLSLWALGPEEDSDGVAFFGLRWDGADLIDPGADRGEDLSGAIKVVLGCVILRGIHVPKPLGIFIC